MKTSKILLVGMVALAGVAMSANGQSGIVNSAHNFSSMAWSGGEICKPCHTPHFANGFGELWNHDNTNATYTMYGGATGTAAADFDNRTRLCLGCHDGTVALDSFGGQVGTSYISSGANIGTDLENDHPIGSAAIYPTMPSTRMRDPATFPSGMRLRTWTDPLGVAQQVVGCTTCHNQHNKGGFDPMLQISNSASALCLACHIK